MTGVAAALELARSGVSAVLLDKGRRPGGRMATRSVGGVRFDHGAQHFSIRGAEFTRVARPLLQGDVIVEWFRSHSRTKPGRGIEARYSGAAGMRSIVEAMAAELTVHTSVVVTRLAGVGNGLAAQTEGGDSISGDAAIVTAPLPQSLRLLTASTIGLSAGALVPLEAVEYESCLALMATLDGAAGLEDGHASPDHPTIAWIGDNHHKGVSPTPAVTIHSTPRFAAENLEADPAQWVSVLERDADDFLASAVVGATPHRWRYSRPTTTLGTGAALVAAAPPVVVAGEAFVSARVEGAFLSGVEAARTVLELL